MIPTVKRLIDIDRENGEGDNHGQRINIPPEELVALGEFRRREYFRQVREDHNSRLLEMEQAEARTNLNQYHETRPYGLLHGEAIGDVWEMILDQVKAFEDIVNLRNTCMLFRGLLEMKYKTRRLIEVVLKFSNDLGGLPTLLSIRGVCRSYKIAVDRGLMEIQPPFTSYVGNFTHGSEEDRRYNMWIQKPGLYLSSAPFDHPMFIPSIISRLEMDAFSRDTFPIRKISLAEHGFPEEALPIVRLAFQRFLELVGTSIRCFKLSTYRDGLDTYNTLRSWVTSMPYIEDLSVAITTFHDPPPGLPLPPFPPCPKLKQYINEGLGLRAIYIAQILLANPWISNVFLCDTNNDPGSMVMLTGEEVAAFQEALAATQMEWFCLCGPFSFPRQRFLEFQLQWPLKQLCLTFTNENPDPIPSRQVIDFINSFSPTLEELIVNWKLIDTGGYLELPKLRKLVWKLWPNFMRLQFMIALDGIQYLDLAVGALPGINKRVRNAKTFINNKNLPSLFPRLREIRTNVDHDIDVYADGWHEVWKA